MSWEFQIWPSCWLKSKWINVSIRKLLGSKEFRLTDCDLLFSKHQTSLLFYILSNVPRTALHVSHEHS